MVNGQLAATGDLLDGGMNGSFYGVHVLDSQLVAERLTFCAGADELGPNQIRAGGLDLAEYKFAAGEGDSDHEYDGGAADNHAERGENGAQLLPRRASMATDKVSRRSIIGRT